MQTAYKAGVDVEYTLNRTWALQSTLEFISIGGKNNIQYVEHTEMHELYLQVPVVVAARLPLGEDYHASLGLGPRIACGVGGKTSGSIKQDYAHSGHDSYYRPQTSIFGSVLENEAGSRRLNGDVIIEVTFEYRRSVIDAGIQVRLVKVSQQLRQVIETEEFQGYLPRNFASFFTVGYKFRWEFRQHPSDIGKTHRLFARLIYNKHLVSPLCTPVRLSVRFRFYAAAGRGTIAL